MENSSTPNPQANPNSTYDLSKPLGQRFREAREQQGISLEQAAAKTFILKRHLEALESNNYEMLPQPTFARGFATNYGRYLGLDAKLVAQSFDAQYPTQLKQQHETVIRAPLQPMGTLHRDVRPGVKINPFIVLGILVALGLAFFIFNTVNKAHTDNQETTTTGVQGITTQEQATGASLNNAGSAIVAPAVPASGLPATGSAINGVPPANGVAIGTVVAATSTLDVLVQKPTTVKITDAAGQILLDGEQAAGTRNLTGQPPFTISIDDVSSVSMDLNKQPIKLSDYAQNNKANFTLNP